MIKNTLLAIIILIVANAGYSQFVPPSGIGIGPVLDCEVNVNALTTEDFRNDIKRAVFKLNIPGSGNCSATLINRNTGQNEMGQYFITAWHCFRTGSGDCNGGEFDFTNSVNLIFNFQSPNDQSQVFANNVNGSVYQISRRVRLVDKFSCAYGDFALCEILDDPIPPYFNVYYAGWYPNELLINANGDFAAIHHPLGNIKKISSADYLTFSTGGVKSTCVTVTKIVDFLFGWIWKRKWSTQVVCTYLQLPFVGPKYEINGYDYGRIEDASSGGGLFTGERGFAGANKLIGQVSASVPAHTCAFVDVGISYYGKLSDSYYRQDVKNTLNPSNDYWVDQNGIPGRQITCHPQININAGAGRIDLYPASFYQQQNAITLTAQSNFVTTGTVIVRNGADFTFQAGETIELNQDFEVESGASFVAEITPSPCTISDGVSRRSTSLPGVTPEFQKVLKNFPAPNQKKFDINKYLPATVAKKDNNVNAFNLYPNPSTGIVNVEFFLKEQEKNVTLDIYDLYGHHVYSKKYSGIYFIKEKLTLPSTNSGMYNLIIKTTTGTYSKRIILAH
jgi:hypothetical protein